MLRYAIFRIASIAPVLFIVIVAAATMIHVAPGDPAALLAGDLATPEQIAAMRERLGSDLPLLVQIQRQFVRFATLDFGTSLFSGIPVTELIGSRLGPTFSLSLLTVLIWTPVAVALGVAGGWRPEKAAGRATVILSLLGFSIPVFVVAYLLIFVFALRLDWLPVQGYSPLSDGLWPWFRSLILPTTALGLGYLALVARIARSTTVEIAARTYIDAAHGRGITGRQLLFTHLLRSAAVPILTVVGNGFGLLLGGAVITETVFNIPGIGRLAVDSILRRDYPLMQGLLVFNALLYCLVNLAVDLLYPLIDPRLRRR